MANYTQTGVYSLDLQQWKKLCNKRHSWDVWIVYGSSKKLKRK